MIASAAIFQIVGCCLAVQGILTQETPQSLIWQELLKEATYRSLIARTELTPSLDEKMETDLLVWAKIRGARFLQKSDQRDDDESGESARDEDEFADRIKSGILVDMTTDGGGLEFRQTERSLSRCVEDKCRQVLKRLLAVWKVQMFGPSNVWIRVQLPRNFDSEDVYEYTPKQGLQKLDVHKWKEAKRRKDAEVNFKETRRQDRQFRTPDFTKHILSLTNGYRNKQVPFSTLNGPTVPRITDNTASQKLHSHPWRDGGAFYQVSPVSTLLTQYQHEGRYDGFLPSTGPTGLPHATYVHPVRYEHIFRNYIASTEPRRAPQYPSTTPSSYFRPSTQFIHYSEPDPLYHGEDSKASELTTLVYPGEVFDYRRQTTTEPPPVLVYGQSETTTDNTVQSTEGSFNSIRVNEPKPARDEKVVRIPGSSKNRLQNTKPTNRPKTYSASSVEAFDYAPLHAKWGQKIKTSVRNKTASKPLLKIDSQVTRPPFKFSSRNSSSTTTTTTTTTTESSTIQATESPNRTPKPTPDVPSTLPSTTTEITTPPSSPSPPPSTTTPEAIKSINMRIEDIKTRTPEEVVNALTNLGVVNTTRVEGYPEISRDASANSTRLLDQIEAAAHDQAVDSSNPISVVINRISRSYSYKTARGLEKDVKLFPLKRFQL